MLHKERFLIELLSSVKETHARYVGNNGVLRKELDGNFGFYIEGEDKPFSLMSHSYMLCVIDSGDLYIVNQ